MADILNIRRCISTFSRPCIPRSWRRCALKAPRRLSSKEIASSNLSSISILLSLRARFRSTNHPPDFLLLRFISSVSCYGFCRGPASSFYDDPVTFHLSPPVHCCSAVFDDCDAHSGPIRVNDSDSARRSHKTLRHLTSPRATTLCRFASSATHRNFS